MKLGCRLQENLFKNVYITEERIAVIPLRKDLSNYIIHKKSKS